MGHITPATTAMGMRGGDAQWHKTAQRHACITNDFERIRKRFVVFASLAPAPEHVGSGGQQLHSSHRADWKEGSNFIAEELRGGVLHHLSGRNAYELKGKQPELG